MLASPTKRNSLLSPTRYRRAGNSSDIVGWPWLMFCDLTRCYQFDYWEKRGYGRRMVSPLEAWALAALQTLPVYKEDVGSPEKPAQLVMIAKAITQAALEQKGWQGSRQQLVAAEIGMLDNETHASLRIHRNECGRHECDPRLVKGVLVHMAISEFQLHANALSDPNLFPQLGGMTFEATLLSAKEASRVLVRSRGWCAGIPGDPIALMYTAVAGHACQLDKWQGWRARAATYQRVLRVPMPASQKQAS